MYASACVYARSRVSLQRYEIHCKRMGSMVIHNYVYVSARVCARAYAVSLQHVDGIMHTNGGVW